MRAELASLLTALLAAGDIDPDEYAALRASEQTLAALKKVQGYYAHGETFSFSLDVDQAIEAATWPLKPKVLL